MKEVLIKIRNTIEEFSRKNSTIFLMLLFILIYKITFFLFSFSGLITQLLIKISSCIFSLDENIIITSHFILLEGQSFLQQYRHISLEIVLDIIAAIIFIFYSFIIFFIITKFYVHHIIKKDFSYIGFKNPKEDKQGIIVAFIFNILTIVYFILVIFFFKDIAMEFDVEIRNVFYINGIDILITVPIPLIYVFLSAIREEIVYRGIVQTILMKNFGKTKGLFITSILFGLLHTQYYEYPIKILSAFLLSLFIGYLYLRRNNLSPPIIFHFIHNLILWSFNRW